MNKKQEAIAKLQQKIEPANGRWMILGFGILSIGVMISTEFHGSVQVGLFSTLVASLCGVGFLAVNLQAVFIKPILEILQDSLEDDNDGEADDPATDE